MALTTRFTHLVGCSVPIQCAGMGTASPALAIEVSKAGGLGMLSGVMLSAEQLEVPRFSVFSPLETATGEVNAMAQYAGQGVCAVTSCEPAADILRQLAEGAESILKADAERLSGMLS